MQKYLVTAAITLTVALSGCGGRAANPVMIAQYGDAKKSCAALELEMSQMQDSLQKLMPKTDKTGKNVALGVTGAFFIVPLFFMDLSQSEQIEVDAFRQRYNHLAVIATDKECDIDAKPIPAFNEKTASADKKAEKKADPEQKLGTSAEKKDEAKVESAEAKPVSDKKATD